MAKACGNQAQASSEAVQQKFASAAANAQASVSTAGGNASGAAQSIARDVQPAVATALASALSSCRCGGGTQPAATRPAGSTTAPSGEKGTAGVQSNGVQGGGGSSEDDECKQVAPLEPLQLEAANAVPMPLLSRGVSNLNLHPPPPIYPTTNCLQVPGRGVPGGVPPGQAKKCDEKSKKVPPGQAKKEGGGK